MCDPFSSAPPDGTKYMVFIIIAFRWIGVWRKRSAWNKTRVYCVDPECVMFIVPEEGPGKENDIH